MERRANPALSVRLYGSKKKTKKIDTVKRIKPFEKNNEVLHEAFMAWTSLDEFREESRRNERYTFGNQWGDKIKNPNGCGYITEEEHIKNQGNVPLKNNRIRGIVRSVLGVFSNQQTEPVCVSRDRDKQTKGEMMSSTLQYSYQLNKLWELDRRNLEYFLISGAAIFKTTYGWRNNKKEVWTDITNYNRIFFDNHMEDPRHWDCHLIGEIHDIGLYDVMQQFADGSKDRALKLREIYNGYTKERTVSYLKNLSEDNTHRNRSFFMPDDETRCRVIEVWKKESRERYLVHDNLDGELYKVELEQLPELKAENIQRIAVQSSMGIEPEDMKLIEYEWFVDNFWQYYFLSPQGDVLKQGETPYWHESHPYSFKLYPFYNKRVYPFVGDFIDQNRYINRLITMQDFVMRASAKGVLLIPEEAIPEGMTIQDIADDWAAYNGVIAYKAKAGVPLPQQVIAHSSQTGAYDMLSIQLKLLEDISGVQGALQGQAPRAGTPASLYMQQTQNSTTSLTDILESFRELREERDYKTMKLIQQNYNDVRYINIVGKDARITTVYNPEEVRNAEFDLSITESTSTPAYRMIMNEFLMQLFGQGQISLQDLLENGAFPFADKLLQSIQARQEEMQNGQPSGEGLITPEIQQQISKNPQLAQMLAVNQAS